MAVIDTKPPVAPQQTNPYSQAETNKFLYETNLQNVFNDYQRNVSTLNMEKQEQLQDAYYIREMSKKYLGEYASNIGVGDVSGNLLDIYGQYQQNRSDIEKYYNQLEMGLQDTYSKERFNTITKIMQEQYNVNVEQLQTSARDVLFNISQGNTDGLDDFAYLERALEQGQLNPELYQTAVLGLQDANFQDAYSVIESGMYANNYDSAKAYLEDNKGKINQKQYDQLVKFAEIKDMEKGLIDFAEPVAANIDPTLFSDNKDITEDSKAFTIGGVNYATVKTPIEKDRTKVGDDRIKDSVTAQDLNTLAAESGKNLVYQPELNTWFYRDTDNKWYRMESLGNAPGTGTSLSDMYAATWSEGSPNFKVEATQSSAGSAYGSALYTNRTTEDSKFKVTIDDRQYVTEQTISGGISQTDPSVRDVYNKFLKVHKAGTKRTYVKNNSAVEYNGKLFFYSDGKIYELERD